MLLQLLGDLGPGEVEGSATEQRNILEVFLRHQAGNGRYSYIVVDGLERFSAAALRELEVLSQLRFRKRPIVYILVLARNEELVANLLPQYNGGPLARAVHQRLAGFTLEETRSYLRACLQGAGCNWAEELIPEEVMLDIQAFTQGVVGDVNAVACGALDALAARAEGGNRQPKVTRAILKEIGTQLNLRYDAERLGADHRGRRCPPDAVHLSDPGGAQGRGRAPARLERPQGRRGDHAESAADGARPRRQLRHQPR